MSPLRVFPRSQRASGLRLYRAQYESQSDFHSKVISCGILFDLLLSSPLLRNHVEAGKVGFGVNHQMSDFTAQRKKDLDLVIATPGAPLNRKRAPWTFAAIAEQFDVLLDAAELSLLRDLPGLNEVSVGNVLVAVEAKATMTAHQKALPRLFDELHSSQATVHGAADEAIAAGICVINHAEEFLSRDLNELGVDTPGPRRYARHHQPHDTQITIAKVGQLPRRSRPGSPGFDALGILVLNCRNDGSPVTIELGPPAPDPTSDFYYDQMVNRIAGQYAYRFSHL